MEEHDGFLTGLRLCKPPLIEEVYPLHEQEECQRLMSMLLWSVVPTKLLDVQHIRNYFGKMCMPFQLGYMYVLVTSYIQRENECDFVTC